MTNTIFTTLFTYANKHKIASGAIYWRAKSDKKFPKRTCIIGNRDAYDEAELDAYFEARPIVNADKQPSPAPVIEPKAHEPGITIEELKKFEQSFNAVFEKVSHRLEAIDKKLDFDVQCFRALNSDLEEIKSQLRAFSDREGLSSLEELES